MKGQLQSQRYERKYFVTERQAVEAREFVKRYLVPDEHSESKPNYSYPIHSLYLDSGNLTTYWDQAHGVANRFKLRLRYYDEDSSSPVFFEIKRRAMDCIRKERSAVLKVAASELVAGHHPQPHYLLTPDPGHRVALQNFWRIMQQLAAQPKVRVTYWREAWIHPENNSLRVTFDRDVCAEALRAVRLGTQTDGLHRPFDGRVILELKYTYNFPDWYHDLVWHFNLVQAGAPKYCRSVETIGLERLTTAFYWERTSSPLPLGKHSWNHPPGTPPVVPSVPTAPK